MPIDQITRSAAFPPSEDGTTHWVIGKLPCGLAYDTTLEYIYDMPTQVVVGTQGSISGDYLAFQQAQQGGKLSAHAYAMRHGENCGDTQYTESRRRVKFEQVRRLASDVPLTGRHRNTA
jgi:hypothetical protein